MSEQLECSALTAHGTFTIEDDAYLLRAITPHPK
jgi:hypothetical protein